MVIPPEPLGGTLQLIPLKTSSLVSAVLLSCQNFYCKRYEVHRGSKIGPSPHHWIFELLSCDVISANKYSLIHPLRGRGDTQNLSDLFHGQSVTCNQL